MENIDPAAAVESPCQECGACCAYSSNWPRFTTEDDSALDLIPEKFVNARLSGMRCDGDRCSALSGRIGVATSCGIYAVRPEVCRHGKLLTSCCPIRGIDYDNIDRAFTRHQF